jgi:F-type H+-transporting ATPase subunit delta
MSASRTERLQIASRYAEAVFVLAEAAGKEEAVVAALVGMNQALAGNGDAMRALANPLFTRTAKAEFFTSLLVNAEALAQAAAGMIARQGRAELLPEISELLAKKLAEKKSEVTAEVTSARALGAAEQQAVAAAIAAATGKKVQLKLTEDASAIGGIKIRLGSHLVDGTVKTALEQMRRQLLAA